MDKEKVKKGLECCFHGQECCGDEECPYYIEHESDSCCLEDCQENLKVDTLALLKEQEGAINDLQKAYGYLQKQFFEAQDKLLKEHEAVKPVLDEQTGRIWLCGKCGSYVGFEDNDPHDPNEFDKYCRECGRPVLWEGR